MALVRGRNVNQALAAAAYGIVSRYGRRLGNEALQELQDAIIQGAEQGGQALQNYLSQWVQHFGNELGNEAVSIATNVRSAASTALERGGQLWNAIQDSTREVGTDNNGQLTSQNSRNIRLRGGDLGEHTTLDELMPDASQANNEALAVSAQRAGTAAATGGSNPVSKETPISNYPTLTYGLQETHTTILPWTGYLTVAEVDKGTPAQLRIRMNAIWDMIDVTTGTSPADGAAFPSKGFYYKMLRNDGKASAIRYPESFADNAAAATERPQWRDYFAALYGWYTVLGCEYKIILQNPVSANGTDIICGVQFDTYSDTATSTGNVMPQTNLAEVKYFKNIQWYTVRPQNSSEKNNNLTIIQGTYKPGQAKRNIVNDGDVKTWTATGTTLPNLKEILTLNFWQDPLCYEELASASHGLNMQIELKYIVQFKDLKQQARYPNTITSDQDIVHTLNEDNTATGTAHHIRQY